MAIAAKNFRTANPSPFKFDREQSGSPLRIIFIIILLCLWEGFPFPLIGVRNLVGYQAFAAIIFVATPIYIIRAGIKRIPVTYWDILPAILFFTCVGTSIYYNAAIDTQPLRQWLPAIYTVSPILMIFALKAVGANMRDAEKALYISGIFGSILVFVNNFANLHLLDFYVRGSGFGTENRVVFFKLESTFALLIGLARIVYARRIMNKLGALLACFFTFYNVFVLSESRLAIAAVLIAVFLTWLFVMRGGRKLFFLLVGPVLAIPLVAYVLDRYLQNANNLNSYLQKDISAKFRSIEILHYSKYFDTTTGLGFGFMSGNPEFDNIISYSANRAGYAYGVGDYPLSLDDIGLYSALYQYGYLGLLLVVSMTLLASWKLGRTGRISDIYAPAGAVGMLMLAFMFSPISMNFFTIFYSAHIGGLLWFMAGTAPVARKRRTRSVKMQLPETQASEGAS